MGRRLDTDEINDLNALITRCEQLINVRRQHDGQSGFYAQVPFTIGVRCEEGRYRLSIAYQDELVASVAWETPSAPGHVNLRPGAWRGQLMALPVHHA